MDLKDRKPRGPLVEAAVKEPSAATTGPGAARDADVPAIVALMNRAFRVGGSGAGWTTEADSIEGSRTTEDMLRQDMASNPDATMLVWRRPSDDSLLGCVWLEPEGDSVWYLGSLTVDPREQNGGLGRKLLAAAENWISERGGQEIRMTVVHVRNTLIAWYERRGYTLTSETKPFPYGDDRFGVPKRDDLHFVVLYKRL